MGNGHNSDSWYVGYLFVHDRALSLIICALGATVGDLGESIGKLPNGKPKIDHRTQEFLKVRSLDPSCICLFDPAPPRSLTGILKNEYAFQIIEKLAFGVVKLSIIFLYRRIFVGRIFNIASWAMIAIVSAWSLSFFLATICECNPRELNNASTLHPTSSETPLNRNLASTIWSSNRTALFTNCIKYIPLQLLSKSLIDRAIGLSRCSWALPGPTSSQMVGTVIAR